MQAEFRKTKDELVYDNILEGPENKQTDLQGTTNKITGQNKCGRG